MAARTDPGAKPGSIFHAAPAASRPVGVRAALHRQWRRLRHAIRPPRLQFVYDPAYERNLAGVALDPLRADRILAFLTNERLLRRDEISLPHPAALKNILLVHSSAYLESLQRPETLTGILGVPVGEGELEDVLELQRLMVGGTIQATRWALAARCTAINLGGGFHHAGRERGAGFCVFNDVAIAIARLRERGFDEPILVVDLDLHDGNGTREIFAADPTVHTFSIHNQHWGDIEAVESTSIALGTGVGDELYLGTLLKTLPRLIESFRPGLVFYVAGSDVAADDRIGDWKLSADAVLTRDRLVVELVRRAEARLVVVLAGGYGVTAWRYPARLFARLAGDGSLEPPSNEDLTLLRFRQIKATLDPAYLTSLGSSDGWQLTEEDLVGILPGVPRHTRFLEYFSKVGVELLLERFGILQQLRARGFRNPHVQLELDHPLGQTLKIFGDSTRRELLLELRLHRSNHAVPGCDVLEVEWLLLQNPRGTFSRDLPALPGQQYPGLGMLPELFGWLMVLCETLALDGVSFRPSHYHVAVLARSHARFLQPEHEAAFRAVGTAVSGLSLAEASGSVEARRVVTAAGGEPLVWQGWPMVLPSTGRLHARVEGEAYARAVEAAAAGLAYRVLAPGVVATPSSPDAQSAPAPARRPRRRRRGRQPAAR
ncbi:MAG TPA: histone deacetylase [Thermoanaerobaculaceae bacterium]|nr:histone deacetylase [Thermoanaerobaculaceae bacterium]